MSIKITLNTDGTTGNPNFPVNILLSLECIKHMLEAYWDQNSIEGNFKNTQHFSVRP
ncbi:MAG: hypothetical protein Q7J78_02345 [Clostridiales bacterium]|nr:hypothetical protein [Clostridiales bacterium]